MTSGPRANASSVNAWNADYLEQEYARFKTDPLSVPADLRAFYEGFELGLEGSLGGGESLARFQSAVVDLIEAYRSLGNLAAQIDPFDRPRPRPAALNLAYHGLSEHDLDRRVDTGSVGLPQTATLREVVAKLEKTYCRSIGAEYMHILDVEERDWLRQAFEEHDGRLPLDRGQRAHLLRQILQAETFERFLGKRYQGEKRFSLEGAESLIPLLNHVLERATDLGAEEVVLGMAHRGRLNVLHNILGKTLEQIFTEFEDTWEEDFVAGGGDVKYHRGYSATRHFPNGGTLRLAMASNPSHLEAVDPVVVGRARAKQDFRGDMERRRVIPILTHGDAAMAGQGIVAEVFNLSGCEGYTTGGTIHIVVNNLIGFTTSPEDGRSSRYCTDVAKMIEAPVFHVNAMDPEAVVTVADLAVRYRQKFRKDVVIDLVCFRRYGHNEQDEASFTQPVLYSLISKTRAVLDVYAERLLAEGVIGDQDMESIRDQLAAALERAQAAAQQTPYDPTIDAGSARWAGLTPGFRHEDVETGVPMETLEEICEALGRVPDGFTINRKLEGLLKARRDLPRTRQISYADAESLAFGSLLVEGIPVRLSGQDCRRGTFSHRHAVMRDFESGTPYVPLNNIREAGEPGTDRPPGSQGSDGRPRQARLSVFDSPLSEASVVGYEYGYSLVDPGQLVLWEAQFGDFVNGAQVITDQFLASAEAKWERWSGLVMLLPHGYEGAGPEHSSARMERFLQLCGNGNMQVVYPTVASQIFHLFRRQVKRSFRKPLIVMTPKSLLRVATSTIDELTHGSFREVIDDPRFVETPASKGGVKRVIFCTGKVYFELAERRDAIARDDLAIIRIEQLYPLHVDLFKAINASYPAAAERVWVQEEPRNAGAYLHIADVLRTLAGVPALGYIGRDASASPAVGSKSRHIFEQESILQRAVGEKPAASASADAGRAGVKAVSSRRG